MMPEICQIVCFPIQREFNELTALE